MRFNLLALTLLMLLLAARSVPAQRPELVVQTGHSSASWNESIETVAFSPDGRYVVSAGHDQKIILWDAATGTQLRTFFGHEGTVKSVAFSPDSRTLASGGWDATVRLWDVESGAQRHRLKVGSGKSVTDGIKSVAFSPNGKVIAVGAEVDNAGKVFLCDAATGERLHTLSDHATSVDAVAFSPDGQTLASGDSDGVIKLWDTKTWDGRHSLRFPKLPQHLDGVSFIGFSPDGRVVMGVHEGRGEVRRWDVGTGAEINSYEGISDPVALSADGEVIASGDLCGTIKLSDARTGTTRGGLGVKRECRGQLVGVNAVAFSRDGKFLAGGAFDRVVRLWDVTTGRELWARGQHAEGILSVAFSLDGRTLAAGRQDAAVKLWGLGAGPELRTLKGEDDYVRFVDFMRDGKTLLSAGTNAPPYEPQEMVSLWDVQTGTRLNRYEPHFQWREASGVPEENPEKLNPINDPNDPTYFHRGARLSPDGKTLAVPGFSEIQLWDVATGLARYLREGAPPGGFALAFSPDGRTLASTGNDAALRLWDVATGAPRRSFAGQAHEINSLAFSPDGATLAGGSADNSIRLWNAETGTLLHTLVGHANSVEFVAFSPDGRLLASASLDGTVKLWDARGGVELATLIALDESDWAVVTPDGLFDGTPGAWGKMVWRISNREFTPVEAYFNEFFYPGLLQEIFAGKRPTPPDGKDIAKVDRRQPTVRVSLDDRQASAGPIKGQYVTVKVEVVESAGKPAVAMHPPSSGARDVRLFRNGSLVKFWAGDAFRLGEKDGCRQQSAGKVVCQYDVPVVAGENRITAYAFNSDNVKSRDAELPQPVIGAESLKRGSTMYIIAVGVDEYQDPSIKKLTYSVKDAEVFGTQVKAQQDALKNYEHTVPVTLLDLEATKANVLYALKRLATKENLPVPEGFPQELKNLEYAKADDAVVFYFSGHGVARGERFYLLTNDVKKGSTDYEPEFVRPGISDLDLEEAYREIIAEKLLMVIDACNSGKALGGRRAGRGPMNSKGLAQLAYDKGMYILTAAQSYQAALAFERLGHGLMTHALIEEGMKQMLADSDESSEIIGREWFDYAVDRVPELQVESMIKAAERKGDPPVVVDEEDDPLLPPEKRNVQVPRVFYRRELEAQPLVVAKP